MLNADNPTPYGLNPTAQNAHTDKVTRTTFDLFVLGGSGAAWSMGAGSRSNLSPGARGGSETRGQCFWNKVAVLKFYRA